MESSQRPGAAQPQTRRRLPDHVDRPGIVPRRIDLSVVLEAGHVERVMATTGALVCFARNRVVDRSAARSPRSKAQPRPDHLPAEDFPEDLGLFRDIRHRAGPWTPGG